MIVYLSTDTMLSAGYVYALSSSSSHYEEIEMSETTTVRQNAINWFEIPCDDLDRATAFYETVLGAKMHRDTGGDPMAFFASNPEGTGGTLVRKSLQRPGRAGTMVYLNVDGELDEVIARIPTAGGLVLQPKTEVPGGFGYFACLRDSEGNHIGLHSH
jgi:predicted enzyme related to lactoylglutathione lyase